MEAMNGMRIGSRLGLGFAAVILLLLVLAGLGVDRMAAVIGNTELILHDRHAKVALTQVVENEVNRQARALRTALITTDVAIIKEEMAKVGEADRRIEETIEQLQSMEHSAESRDALETLLKTRQPYAEHKARLVELVIAQSLDEGGVYLIQSMLPAQNAYLSAVEAFGRLQAQAMMEFGEEAIRGARNARLAMIGLAAAAVLLAIGIAFFMTRSITRPISRAVAVAETVARGDLTSRIEVRSPGETGQLLSALQRMNEELITIVRQVRDSSESIATGASQIASGNADLSRRTEQQAASLQQTSAAMEQLTAMSQHSAENAGIAARLANEAREVAMKGGAMVRQVVATMAEIAAGAGRISEIIGVIDGIALQTNILALNAAVEGARAAGQGRGFAVVAEEVRALAQRASEAARDIKALIGASVEGTQAGGRLVEDAGGAMAEIVRHVDRVAQLIGEIDTVTQEQHAGIGRASDAVGELDRVTRQNAALVEESAAAAESLSAQSARLADVVRSFRLDSARPDAGGGAA